MEVDIGWVAEDLCKEMLSFLVIEQIDLLLLILAYLDLSVFIDPLQEETLIRIEIGLLNE